MVNKKEYDATRKLAGEGFCLRCGKRTKFTGRSSYKERPYNKFCSRTCVNKYRWENAAYRNKVVKSIKKYCKQNKQKRLAVFQSEEYRSNMGNVIKQRWKNKEYRNKLSVSHAKSWTDARRLQSANRAVEQNNNPNNAFGTGNTQGVIYVYKNILFKHGSWEPAFLRDALLICKKVIYHPCYFEYFDKQKQKRKYTPDFYLPELDIYIEVKSDSYVAKSKEMVARVRKQNNVRIWFITYKRWKYVLTRIKTELQKTIPSQAA